ncbi:ureidoglycolate lyase [Phaeobacter sp. B1627]|uniref:ureidoglycolate lyase n=1 Tax=Phaeobacter sp. B1627 TaxID=2583809 RepID=UPI0011191FF0|nr:ureidoglycolate lyase [Phaeobacter sp. B1627]TNJ41369.1 ureidoglycolate lyase [Phaeobacter sp. B1627]
MSRVLEARRLTADRFAPFGDVLAPKPVPDKMINQGKCARHHDLAQLDFADGRAGISLFDAEARALPYSVELVERHPSGSQAFVPLDGVAMLIIVAPDAEGKPGPLQAFVSQPGQSINLHRGTWHGVLAPLGAPGKYIVIDRIGAGANLEEHWFDDPWTVTAIKD